MLLSLIFALANSKDLESMSVGKFSSYGPDLFHTYSKDEGYMLTADRYRMHRFLCNQLLPEIYIHIKSYYASGFGNILDRERRRCGIEKILYP